jgi:acetyl-CoA synthetase
MSNYHQVAKSFNLDGAVEAMLSGSVEQLNACYECCDRHADAESEQSAL